MSDDQVHFRKQYIRGRSALQSPPSIMFTDRGQLAVSTHDGYVETWLRRIEGSDIVFGRVRSSGHSIQLQDSSRLTVLIPREGRLRIQVGSTEHGVSPARPMAFRPGERSTDAIVGPSGRFAATTLQISMGRLKMLAECAQLPIQDVLGVDGFDLRERVPTAFVEDMKRLADDILRLPEAPLPARVSMAIENSVHEKLLMMLGSLAAPTRARVLPAFHRVRAAEEIMHGQGDDPLSMIDLAQQLGCSLRSLQLAFREVHDGMSPRQVYNQIRLQRARRRLQEASRDDQVTRIALEAGFLHLSRFAQAYARTFGELPHETLARRRS